MEHVSESSEVVSLSSRQESQYTKAVYCSLDDEDFPAGSLFPCTLRINFQTVALEFFPGDRFSMACELSLAPPDDFFEDSDAVLDLAGRYRLEWRRSVL